MKKIKLFIIFFLVVANFCISDSIKAKEENSDMQKGYIIEQNDNDLMIQKGEDRVSFNNINNTKKIHSYKADSNPRFLYYTDLNCIYKYDLLEQKELKLDYELPSYNRTDCYMIGDVFFIGNYLSSSEPQKFSIIGYDVNKNQEVYNKKFDFPQSIGSSFVVDSKWNFYFSIDNAIIIYDKNGDQIDRLVNEEKSNQFSLNNLSPNEKILFFNASYYYEGFVPLENNRFVDKNFYLFSGSYRTPNWKFINKSEYAINQYGELAKFNYNEPNAQSKRSYELIYSLHLSENNFYEIPADYDDNYLYVGDDNGNIMVVDYQSGEVVKHKYIGEGKDIVRIDYYDNELYVIYDDGSYEYGDIVINVSDFENISTNVISDHSTLKRTKDQVRKNYLESRISYDYGKSIFNELPSSIKPYKAGSLKTTVSSEILKEMNYYRWQAGLNNLTLNQNYMERSQKGAVVLAATNELTHYPSQPGDMSDEFYDEAFAGVNADFDYSGNVCWDYSLRDYIKGYIDDTNNLMGDVGHRNSFLDPRAKSTSFGFANNRGELNYFYNATSIYTTNQHKNSEKFYSWPSPGYMPIESIDINAKWSITLMEDYDFTKTNINLIIDGKVYSIKDIYLDREYNTLYFSLPNDVIKLVSRNSKFKNNVMINVELNDIRNSIGDKVLIKYPVKFFEAKIENGWNKKENGEWEYYRNGKQVDGWQSIEGLQYYFRNKEMVHDWFLDENTQTWYFFNGGVMQRTNLTINDITYRFDNYGIWRGYDPRWVWYENNYYYKDEWNNNLTGWQSIEGLQYKFREDGTMIRDWYLDENTQTWYFFNGGVMQRTNLIINGKVNIFDKDGIWRGIQER